MDKILMAINIITNQLNNGGKLEELLENYDCPAGNGLLTGEEKEEIRIKITRKKEFDQARQYAEVEDPALVADPEGHEEWYDDWLEDNRQNRYYWLRLNNFLEKKLQKRYSPGEAGAIVRSIDKATDMVVSRLEHPQRPAFQTKGLVLGHVQSGKTANFTGVIAKAVDAGYRLIIVLTGIHNNLRSQTQQRLDCELTGEPEQENLEHVEVPALEHRQWVRMTNHECDFDEMNLSRLDVLGQYRRPMLVVMKKNCPVMRRFVNWISNSSTEVRSTIPLLLIDDEADQASIDTNYSKDTDPTATNELIRSIISYFPKHAYVGYTATPFANVLINMNTNDNDLGRDLYPRNFIVSLPRPEGYLGAEQIFSNGQSEQFVRIVPSNEISLLVPTNKSRHIPRQITPSLERAILTFCLSAAARYEREQKTSPMTMLIHTTHLQDGHKQMKVIVEPFCNSIRSRWNDQYEKEVLREKFKKLWDIDFVKTTNNLYPDRVRSFEQIEPFLGEFLSELNVYELNASAQDKLDYTEHPDIKVVAIGGNRLSRGLTLEGLMTSFYLRKSQAYDTLLQMGRWFGYRIGYEDLTRVFTSQTLASNFEDLALVEQELREEIKIYEDEDLTPAEMSVRVRSHQRMKITAPNKMGAANRVQGSFSERLAQTIWFPLDQPEILKKNLKAGEELIKNIDGWEKRGGSYLKEGVSGELVLSFLKNYKFVDNQVGLDSDGMITYINRHINEELARWNVCVVGQEKPNQGNKAISFGNLPDKIIPVRRSRVKDQKYKTGVLSSPSDLVIDLSGQLPAERTRTVPLLLLYRVWKESTPKKQGKLEPLFKGIEEKVDVLGIVIDFPKSTIEPYDYFAQPDKERNG